MTLRTGNEAEEEEKLERKREKTEERKSFFPSLSAFSRRNVLREERRSVSLGSLSPFSILKKHAHSQAVSFPFATSLVPSGSLSFSP